MKVLPIQCERCDHKRNTRFLFIEQFECTSSIPCSWRIAIKKQRMATLGQSEKEPSVADTLGFGGGRPKAVAIYGRLADSRFAWTGAVIARGLTL